MSEYIVVADNGSHHLKKYDFDWEYLGAIVGPFESGSPASPTSVSRDSNGNLYAVCVKATWDYHDVLKFVNEEYDSCIVSIPVSICFTAKVFSDALWVSVYEDDDYKLKKYSLSGSLLATVATGWGPTQTPRMVMTEGPNGDIYVAIPSGRESPQSVGVEVGHCASDGTGWAVDFYYAVDTTVTPYIYCLKYIDTWISGGTTYSNLNALVLGQKTTMTGPPPDFAKPYVAFSLDSETLGDIVSITGLTDAVNTDVHAEAGQVYNKIYQPGAVFMAGDQYGAKIEFGGAHQDNTVKYVHANVGAGTLYCRSVSATEYSELYPDDAGDTAGVHSLGIFYVGYDPDVAVFTDEEPPEATLLPTLDDRELDQIY